MNEPTLVMGDDETRRARLRSLQKLYPPLRIPGYEQEQFLGKGAFGEVWVATDSNSGRPVAIKFYSNPAGLDWSLLAREVEKLRHLFADRYVVQLLAVGWDADPPYYVMEYMENGSLQDLLHVGPLSVAEAVPLFREIVVGLVHAHGKGILHCDLKPGNILLDQDGKPRLADFGQARLPHEHTPSLGTLFYMAPEQANLEALPDARWDVYALGAVLYHMLTGEVPYRNEPAAEELLKPGPLEERLERYRRLLETSPRPSAHRRVAGVDGSLADLIDHCLAVNPRHRFSNAQAVLNALDARSFRRARRPLLVLGAIAPALVVLIMILAGGYLFESMVADTEEELIYRALESNRFAALAMAERVALNVDKRWRILEMAAADPEMQERLKRFPGLAAGSEERKQVQDWLQKWVDNWLARSDEEFIPDSRATSWFINDRTGVQVARSPLDEETRGRNWAFRDYFHGKGRDLSPDEARANPPQPIRRPHRSIVFQSQATKTMMAAFSVPIWDTAGPQAGQKEPIGVLAMTATLGQFGEVKGTRDQFAVLVDTRPSASGERGVIVEHPGLRMQAGTQLYSLDTEFLERVTRLQERKLQTLTQSMQDRTGARTPDPWDEDAYYPGDYHDPLSGEYSGRWLASLEPVFITRGREEIRDTGWIVVVQERTQDTVRPVVALTGKLVRGGLVALGIVVAVVTALWGAVMFLLDEPTRSRASAFWRRLGLPGSSTSTGRSSPALPRKAPTLPALTGPGSPQASPAGRTVQMDVRNPRSRPAQQDTQTG